jgi:hypothetical protein
MKCKKVDKVQDAHVAKIKKFGHVKINAFCLFCKSNASYGRWLTHTEVTDFAGFTVIIINF